MSKKANPAAIGAFVLVALVVAVAGILTLGSGKLFKKTEAFVLYFDGSLSGLDVGAPVEYNGIRIGAVTDINLVYNTTDGTLLTPVYIEIEQQRMKYTGPQKTGKGIEYHIEQGMRAQLQSQSFITGKLKISLIIDPDSPIRLVGADPATAELPTLPSLLESIGKSLDDLPIADIVKDIRETTKSLSDISNSGEIQAILRELRETSESLSTLTDSADLHNAIKEFTATVQTARYLLDYLERHPESLIHGKGEE